LKKGFIKTYLFKSGIKRVQIGIKNKLKFWNNKQGVLYRKKQKSLKTQAFDLKVAL
jgi:hypothetical protein